MEDSNVLLSALDNWRSADNWRASTRAQSGLVHSSDGGMASSVASSTWTDAWAFRGIPELDSPLAG